MTAALAPARTAPQDTSSASTGLFERTAVTRAPALPRSVLDVVSSCGRPLGASALALERRFGHDFSRVRVHTDMRAAASARDVDALAYTVGRQVVFGDRQFAPETTGGRCLLAHELTHALQQREEDSVPSEIAPKDDVHEREAAQVAAGVVVTDSARPMRSGGVRLACVPDDPTERARYPSAEQRRQVREVLDPQASRGSVPPVTDPGGFRADMTERLNERINALLPAAQTLEASAVSLGLPQIQSLSDLVQPAVERVYGSYLRAAAHSPAEQASRTAYRLRSHTHLVSERAADADKIACQWVSTRMQQLGADLLDTYDVLVSEEAAKEHCGGGASTAAPGRDQALFQSVLDGILARRAAALRTIVLSATSFEEDGEVFIQSKVAAHAGESTDEARRRGRWTALGTLIHEMLHAVAHEAFRRTANAVESTTLAVEGFAEYFTRPVYADFTSRAAENPAVRASIEGVQAPFNSAVVPQRSGYQELVDEVERLKEILDSNEENLRVAYFMGRVEYLGLGGWTGPGNVLGGAALLVDQHGFFRVDYGRVVLGRAGNLQLQLGGTINYLTEGNRLGLGGTANLQYSWPNVYVRGGAAVGGSASLTQPFSTSVRMDLIPGVEAGVRIGIVRVGAGMNLLIPVGGPVSERTLKLGALVGISADF
jgi:Domain of unknown function (DUF4157)